MPYHFGEFITKKESAGLIIVSQRLPIATVAEEPVMIWAAILVAMLEVLQC